MQTILAGVGITVEHTHLDPRGCLFENLLKAILTRSPEIVALYSFFWENQAHSAHQDRSQWLFICHPFLAAITFPRYSPVLPQGPHTHSIIALTVGL